MERQGNTEIDFEKMLIQYVEQFKDLLSVEVWQNVLLNCSKNELFILWFLYRNHEVNMTQIAEYIHVPLNTATGIISRMEKRNLILRNHSAKDKRVVTIALSEEGDKQLKDILNEVMFYIKRLFVSLTPEESKILFQVMNKVTEVLKTKPDAVTEHKKVRKITID